MHIAFAEIWHSEMSSFHLPIDETTITLDDIAFLLHLPMREMLLDHSKISRIEATYMIMTLLGGEYDDSFEHMPSFLCMLRTSLF